MRTYLWLIKIESQVRTIHPLDKNVPGLYIRHGMTKQAVLDDFHATVPIKVLDDFDISVEEI
jgi:hypothetical protein